MAERTISALTHKNIPSKLSINVSVGIENPGGAVHGLLSCPDVLSPCHKRSLTNLRKLWYSTVQYSTAQHSTAQYSTVQHSTVQYSTVQHSTAQYSTVQHSTVQYSTAQYSTVRAQNVGPNHRSEIVQNRQIRPRPRPRPGCQDPPCRRPRAPAADVAPAGPAVAAAPAHDRAGRGGVGGGAAAAAGGHPAPPHQRAHRGGGVGALHRGGDSAGVITDSNVAMCRTSRLSATASHSEQCRPRASTARGQGT